MIEVRELHKNYGDLHAVDGVSFEIAAGEAFGLLGPNGAGKSTTILMIVGALAPDSGQVMLDGQVDPTRAEVRRKVGIAPQDLAIYDELTGSENLAFFGKLYGMRGAKLAERVDWGLEFAGLEDRRADRAAGYSGGMKRRLNLACALIHAPRIFFCDEPTVGVDPQSRNHIFESIEGLKRDGCTLIYTTHYMEEAERLCDRVAIIDSGKVLAVDTPAALVDQHGGASIVEAEFTEAPPPDLLQRGTFADGWLKLETDRPIEAIAALGKGGADIANLRIRRPNLERVFLHLTGRSLRD